MENLYVVHRETPDAVHIRTVVVAGPFTEMNEATNVRDEYTADKEKSEWYEVWTEKELENRDYL